jgi:transposase
MKEPEKVKLTQAEGEALIERIKASDLTESDRRVLERLVHMYFWLLFTLQEAKLSLKRLKELLFGKARKAETQTQGISPNDAPSGSAGSQGGPSGEETQRDAAGRRKRGGGKPAGQGRRSADAYTGAERVLCSLEELAVGQRCPACDQGSLYRLPPGVEVRIDGNGFLTALRYELEKLRCSACGQVYTAGLPPEAGEKKYTDRARAVLALGRYYLGLPFNRLEGYQRLVGVPVADATQWDQVEQLAGDVWPVFNELVYQAAQGERLYEDDTPVRVLSMIQENTVAPPQARTGMYTTGLVAQREGHEIGLYFSGRANAGENAGALVQQREPAAGPLILMSDALSANRLEPAPPVEVIVCFCLAHGLRKFSDLEEAFPQPCAYVLGVLDQVFEHDQAAREHQLSADDRLAYHRQHSGPLMDALHGWLEQQIEDREVEPNSALGKAFHYLRGHWTELTQFLRVAGAPLDSNVVERALKLMIRQRNNSLFFASAYSAQVGSVLCSVIATALKAGINVLDYLVALQRHRREVLQCPSRWLPWNYAAQLAPA